MYGHPDPLCRNLARLPGLGYEGAHPEGDASARSEWNRSRLGLPRASNRSARASLIEVRLRTGRRNQIRIQARLRGHTLVGEERYVYGPDTLRTIAFGRQALHAYRLRCQHPADGRALDLEAAPPADFHGFADSAAADGLIEATLSPDGPGQAGRILQEESNGTYPRTIQPPDLRADADRDRPAVRVPRRTENLRRARRAKGAVASMMGLAGFIELIGGLLLRSAFSPATPPRSRERRDGCRVFHGARAKGRYADSEWR